MSNHLARNFFMNTRYFFLLSIACALFQSTHANLTKAQAACYLSTIIDGIFFSVGITERPSEIQEFTKKTTILLLAKLGSYDSKDFWALKAYTTDELRTALIAEIKSFIEQKSLTYAQEDSKNLFIHTNVNQHKIIAAAAKAIVHKAGQLLEDNGLKRGVLSDFIGASLHSMVQNQLKAELKKIPTPAFIMPKA